MSDRNVEISSEGKAAILPEQCQANAIKKLVVYSRGNSDPDEMAAFKAATGKYVYETAQFNLAFQVDPNCMCQHGGCVGNISVKLRMSITMRGAEFAVYVPDFSLVPGPDPKPCTVETSPGMLASVLGTKPPRPNVSLTFPKTVSLPPPVQGNKFEPVAPLVFTATATTKVPCAPGEYCKRFYVVATADLEPPPAQNTTFVPPITLGEDPNMRILIVDCQINVTSPRPCVLNIKFKAYLMEFMPNYDFGGLPDVDKELPQVDHREMGGINPGTTRSVTKLIVDDSVTIDSPFPPAVP